MIVSEELEEEKPPLSEQDPLLLGFDQLSPNYSCTRVRSHVQDCAITQPVLVSSSSRTLRRRYLRTWGLVVAFALFAFAIYDSSFGDDSVVDWPDWPDWMVRYHYRCGFVEPCFLTLDTPRATRTKSHHTARRNQDATISTPTAPRDSNRSSTHPTVIRNTRPSRALPSGIHIPSVSPSQPTCYTLNQMIRRF